MGFLIKAGMGLLLLAVLFIGFIMVASELAGETITLRSYRADGLAQETSLWVVEDQGQLWIRAGQPDSKWLARIRARPEVDVTRAGQEKHYRAVVVPGQLARINRLMAERYGWVDRALGMLRDSSASVPIRLEVIRR